MEAAPTPHERAMEPKNILRQLSIRKEDCREGGGGGEFWTVAAAPPPHERAMESKNILRQLSIQKEDCREGGGGAGV